MLQPHSPHSDEESLDSEKKAMKLTTRLMDILLDKYPDGGLLGIGNRHHIDAAKQIATKMNTRLIRNADRPHLPLRVMQDITHDTIRILNKKGTKRKLPPFRYRGHFYQDFINPLKAAVYEFVDGVIQKKAHEDNSGEAQGPAKLLDDENELHECAQLCNDLSVVARMFGDNTATVDLHVLRNRADPYGGRKSGEWPRAADRISELLSALEAPEARRTPAKPTVRPAPYGDAPVTAAPSTTPSSGSPPPSGIATLPARTSKAPVALSRQASAADPKHPGTTVTVGPPMPPDVIFTDLKDHKMKGGDTSCRVGLGPRQGAPTGDDIPQHVLTAMREDAAARHIQASWRAHHQTRTAKTTSGAVSEDPTSTDRREVPVQPSQQGAPGVPAAGCHATPAARNREPKTKMPCPGGRRPRNVQTRPGSEDFPPQQPLSSIPVVLSAAQRKKQAADVLSSAAAKICGWTPPV